MDWQIATQTHRGNKRKTNEDALLVVSDFPLLVVADGMGGHKAGEVASQIIVDNLSSLALEQTLELAQIQAEQSLSLSNRQSADLGVREHKGATIGSTVVAMLAKNARAVCLWAGDSRLYRLRDESLQQLTEDHSYVAELVREGQLSVEEAKHHPSANMITRAIGVSPSVDIAVKPFEVLAGDTYLLCSDGLYNEVAEAELQSTLLSSDVYRSSVQLLNLCLGRAARDNITFIIAHAHNDSLGQTDMDQTILDPSQTRLG